jgi:RimJ/RimL family protein N-acetyltransferase
LGADEPDASAHAGIAVTEAWPRRGPRVALRRLHEGDLVPFQAYRCDVDVGRWQGWEPMADEAATAFLREMATAPWCPAGAWFQLAIADAQDDRLLGDIGLHLAADGLSLEIGFTLAPGAQGRGLAAEAVGLALAAVFAHTPARGVVAITDVLNTASVKLLRRLGFELKATQDALFRGAPCREHHFLLQRPEVP